ncbi:MAG: sulfurtransferase [Naasia sp.]
MPILISPRELHDLVEAGEAPVVLDVRWRLDQPDGRPAYLQGHLPGAVYVDLGTELSRHGRPDEGRHPLPDIEDLGRSARRWGIDDGDTVVVYDDLNSLSAARAWWLLRWAGVEDVRILDGALAAWRAEYPVESGEVAPVAGGIRLSAGHLPTVDADGAAAWPGSGVLLDARAAGRFTGEIEPIDPRAGHIPGAVSAPTTENVDADGRFLEAEALRSRFARMGVEQGTAVAVYCGSGVTAAHQTAALTIAGFDPVLYPGSWSQWSNEPGRPVARGG